MSSKCVMKFAAAERCFSTHDWKEKKEKHKNLKSLVLLGNKLVKKNKMFAQYIDT